MGLTKAILFLIIGLIIGVIIAFVIVTITGFGAGKKANKIISDAKKEADKHKRDTLLELKEESHKLKLETDKEIKERKSELLSSESRLQEREKSLDKREELLQKRDNSLEERNSLYKLSIFDAMFFISYLEDTSLLNLYSFLFRVIICDCLSDCSILILSSISRN